MSGIKKGLPVHRFRVEFEDPYVNIEQSIMAISPELVSQTIEMRLRETWDCEVGIALETLRKRPFSITLHQLNSKAESVTTRPFTSCLITECAFTQSHDDFGGIGVVYDIVMSYATTTLVPGPALITPEID